MSTVTLSPGDLIVLDPSDKRVVVFDFDELNLPAGVSLTSGYVITVTALKQSGATALTTDNDSRTGSNRKVQVRLLATTATVGDLYEVACKGVTDETPAQEKEYSVRVLIENR